MGALIDTVSTALRHLLDAPPLLPALTVMHVGWRLAWALVLGAGLVWVGQALGISGLGRGRLFAPAGVVAKKPYVRRLPTLERGRFSCAMGVAAAMAVMLWTLWPGAASPAHWLALVFQSPSLVSALLCARYLWTALSTPWATPIEQGPTGAVRSDAGLWLAALGSLLGWLLLGDTLACWLPSVYAWGFKPAALMTAIGVLLAFWWLGRRSMQVQRISVVLALVLVLFVLTRLPTGNLWDALLDPWLWLLLQLALLRALWQRTTN